MHRAPRWAAAVAGLMAVSAAFAAPVAGHSSGYHITTLAAGLDNPRGVSIDGKGRVLVAVAGRGGTGGYGLTGQILRITGKGVSVLSDGLPSVISPEGEVSGPVNADAGRDGKVIAAIGGGPQGVNPAFDTLTRIKGQSQKVIADIQAFRNTHPDSTDLDIPPNPTDSNAYGLAVLPGGRKLVTDAAGNDLLLVKADGRIRRVAKFPNEVVSTAHVGDPTLPPMLPAEAVPTSVAVGPDGYWYVGELKGFPFTPGESRIWRVAPWAKDVTCDPNIKTRSCSLYADGFTSIIDLDFGPHGDLYVLEIAKNGVLNLFVPGGDTTGALYRVAHHHRSEILKGMLDTPGGLAVTRKGTIYVTNLSTSVGGGQVLRLSH